MPLDSWLNVAMIIIAIPSVTVSIITLIQWISNKDKPEHNSGSLPQMNTSVNNPTSISIPERHNQQNPTITYVGVTQAPFSPQRDNKLVATPIIQQEKSDTDTQTRETNMIVDRKSNADLLLGNDDTG